MNKYEGKCSGGPLDGRMMAHWSKARKFYRPMMPAMTMGDPPVVPVEIGEYRLNDFSQWHWWATAEGKALDTLIGPPHT